MTEIGADTIAAMNRDLARLAIEPVRSEAVRIEVRQLAAAMEITRRLLTFDSEPADFLAEFASQADARGDD